ncbi:zinc ABC transporter substrate-binding protein [Hyphomicrobium sp.]|uniref:zinc ABC transporter substrate-binding protein n=1 Tax=Hyphomicrobium sp. TaxID=82 RepID=UPI001DE2310D|nr:zinc ABC transporter substrate-binding protein [Hyphomicrobium sp.]MBY0560936.1 zinc ABC transporter substrate-binding protein [Hyphomicrobium sp.]
MGRAARYSVFLIALAQFAVPGTEAAEAPKVVVTTKPIHSLVSRVMEGVGVPQLIVEGSASPHTFTLKPSTARAIHDADVFVRVSDQLEPFTRKIVSSLPANVTVLTLAGADGVKLLDQRKGSTFEKHEHGHEEAATEAAAHSGAADEHDDDHDEDGKDGHIWLDPQNAKAIAADVAKVLEARYPEQAEKIKANTSSLIAEIDALDGELAAELNGSKGKPFIVFHDATQYFENHFGQSAAGSITVSPDVPPSAKRLTEVRRKLSSLGAVCVFTEPSFQPNLVAAVTEGTNARAGTIDAEGQMLTPGPGLYFELMRGMAHNIASCLKGEG